jgi:hypothetical protein
MLHQAFFVGLEGVGSGEIVYLTRQGLCAHCRPDPHLAALAERVARQRPDLGVRAAEMTMEDDVSALLRAGYRGICIAGLDPKTGSLPHWHRPDDTPDTVSDATLKQTTGFVMELLGELDDLYPQPSMQPAGGKTCAHS